MLDPVEDSRIQSPRMYQASLFINRASEIEEIAAKVRHAQSSTTSGSIINFWGVKGIGKTWILRELHRRYAYHPEQHTKPFAPARSTFALFYSFSAASPSFEQILHDLADETLSQLSAELSPQEYNELAHARDIRDLDTFIKVFSSLSRRFVALILLDNAEKALQTAWEQIELRLIEPLITTNQMLIVVAGRRQVPRWRRFEVRRRVVEPDQSYVRPFDKHTVTKQLAECQYYIPTELVFPFTGGGNPHLVDAIAHHFAMWTMGTTTADLNRDWLDLHRASLVQILRSSEAQLLENIPVGLLQVLEVLVPLRYYRLEALRFMLKLAGVDEELPDLYYLNILRDLNQQTDVMWWDRTCRAYVTSPVVRQLVNQRQLLENHGDFAAKHRQALEMYWGWVRDLPNASEDFIGEILFHQASLFQADRDLDALQSQSRETIQFAKHHLTPDRFLVIRMQFEEQTGDQEFLSLLPESIYTQLIHELD